MRLESLREWILIRRVEKVEWKNERPPLGELERAVRRDRKRIFQLSLATPILATMFVYLDYASKIAPGNVLSFSDFSHSASTAWGTMNPVEIQAVLMGLALPLFLAVSIRRPSSRRQEVDSQTSGQRITLDQVSWAACIVCSTAAWTIVPTTVAAHKGIPTALSGGIAILFAALAALSYDSEDSSRMSLGAAKRRERALGDLLESWKKSEPNFERSAWADSESSRALWRRVLVICVVGATASVGLSMFFIFIISRSREEIGNLLVVLSVAQTCLLCLFVQRMVTRGLWVPLRGRYRSLSETFHIDFLLLLLLRATLSAVWVSKNGESWNIKETIVVLLFSVVTLIVRWCLRRSALINLLRIQAGRRTLSCTSDWVNRIEVQLSENSTPHRADGSLDGVDSAESVQRPPVALKCQSRLEGLGRDQIGKNDGTLRGKLHTFISEIKANLGPSRSSIVKGRD